MLDDVAVFDRTLEDSQVKELTLHLIEMNKEISSLKAAKSNLKPGNRSIAGRINS